MFVNGDARHIPLADESVQCVVTSPPYWGLRDYGVEGQIGHEDTVEQYVGAMVQAGREIRRVLRGDGTLWLVIGDTYARNPGKGVKFAGDSGAIDDRQAVEGNRGPEIPCALKPKDLVGLPWRLAFALQDDGWWLRTEVIWDKPNASPENVGDRPTRSHEYVFLLSKSERYFFDSVAIEEPGQSGPSDLKKMAEGRDRLGGKNRDSDDPMLAASKKTRVGRKRAVGSPGTRRKRTVWRVATSNYTGAHFAAFPPKLIEPCILAGTSHKGCCPRCGSPWDRIVDNSPMEIRRSGRAGQMGEFGRTQASGTVVKPRETVTLGWKPTCACGSPEAVPCKVLDPFVGSGTTVEVATQHNRLGLGMDLSFGYLNELARKRCRAVQRRLVE